VPTGGNIKKVIRFLGWWLGLSSVYAMSSAVCPVCGKPGCPVGAGLAGIVGGVFTLLMQNWKHTIKNIFKRKIPGGDMDANEILKNKKIFAVIGVPQDELKYGFELFHTLLEHNYRVYPINPKYPEISGHKCYPSLDELPEKPEVIVAVLAPQNTFKIIDQVAKIPDAIFWIPPGSWSDEVIEKCNQLNIKYIYDTCPVGALKGF
jgi:predicted CoA-binding protein